MPPNLPPFADLPLNKSDPPHSAWNLYGPHDALGTLNRLTPPLILAASREIKTGHRISLDLPLDFLASTPLFGRHRFKQEVIEKKPRAVNDDVWSFNTQSSSQWDGLRHFAYQKERRFYGGATMEDIHAGKEEGVLGIQHMARQGIVGRGVLLDYASWCVRHGIEHNPFETRGIKLEHLKEVAREQGTEFKFGDILIIRSGFTEALDRLSAQERREVADKSPPALAGVERSDEVLEWIWSHFSAVAADHPSFESWPPSSNQPSLHEVLLAGWGCPIGELWDLEALAGYCEELGRWSFFLTSKPNCVGGGVASPPNAVAVF
ncbi:MAG: hypothetical protein M1828_006109 [Chrysothrix sp. TS-e1954]|nr:MAG: hypothetical protein M1828_006109 [Chrysothrix sp. TS-e1954]